MTNRKAIRIKSYGAPSEFHIDDIPRPAPSPTRSSSASTRTP